MFVALPGDPGARFNPSYVSQADGHDFVGAALQQTALSRPSLREPVPVALPQIVVSDTYDALVAFRRHGAQAFGSSPCARLPAAAVKPPQNIF